MWTATSYSTQTNWLNYRGQSFPSPYNLPFFMVMDLAIGGDYTGDPTVGPSQRQRRPSPPKSWWIMYAGTTSTTPPASSRPPAFPPGSPIINCSISWFPAPAAHLQTQYSSANDGLNVAAWADLPYSNSPALLNLQQRLPPSSA